MHRIHRLLLLTTLAVAAVPYGTGAHASEDGERGCRCILTFSSGASHEAFCDGFDPSTHQRCSCEKQTAASGTPTCMAKSTAPGEHSATRDSDRRTRPRN